MRRATLCLGLLVTLMGCKNECDTPARINGSYAVNTEISSAGTITGDNLDAYPEGATFLKGWSEWDLQYQPAQIEVDIDINGQSYTADYLEDPTSCNAFGLSFVGTWLAEGGTLHNFEWVGDLHYVGTHLEGDFSYSDSWSDPATGEAGTIEVSEGSYTANQRGS
jgi:uncharacterized lipoprotein NlpE involved in copper resistance